MPHDETSWSVAVNVNPDCICPGGWQNCLHDACPVCAIVDIAEEPYPCADEDES